jgi:hypothetical protein
MEDLAQEIIVGVVAGLIVEILASDIRREWELGWERDYEAGGVSYQNPDEGSVEVLNNKAIRQILTRSKMTNPSRTLLEGFEDFDTILILAGLAKFLRSNQRVGVKEEY